MKWTLWPRSDNSRPNSEPTIPLPPYVGKTVMPMFILVVGGWWLVIGGRGSVFGNRSFSNQPPTTNHQLRIHIHRLRQQRDGVADVQRFADEERFAAFDSNQRAEITVARLYFAQEDPGADARLWFRRLWVEKLRGVRADRLPFALGSFADVDDEARRDPPWEEEIRDARR